MTASFGTDIVVVGAGSGDAATVLDRALARGWTLATTPPRG